MADSRGNLSFGQEEGEDHQAGAAAAKNRKISNCKLAPMTHTIICPTLTMTEKNGFLLCSKPLARCARARDVRTYVTSLRDVKQSFALLYIVRWCEATIRGIMPEHL